MLLRVTQINAIFLDSEIEKLFRQLLQNAFKHLPPGFLARMEPEINLLLRFSILNYSILRNGSTFGQQMLNVQYENMSTVKKALYVIFNCLDYFKIRCEHSFPSHSISRTISTLYVAYKILDFINISVFLKNGVKPRLSDRILGLNQVYSSGTGSRSFTNKYMTRELLWNGFIEIMIYTLPLINFYKLKRVIKQYIPSKKQKSSLIDAERRVLTVNTKCAHCELSPILPHHMGCAHIFCYVCLKGNLNADSKYECPKCGHKNPKSVCNKIIV